jgi:predicted nuclease of predicted toxin-antitoxin system
MRFYSNENFPLMVVKYLRELGHDVLTTLDAGQANQGISDEDVLAYSVENKRAVITLNRKDFIKLHKLKDEHCGIVVCKVDSNYEEMAKRIHKELEDIETIDKLLIRINRGL